MTRSRRRSARTRTLKELRFESFPSGDSLWWIRWVDYASAGTSGGSSRLWVVLSRLPDGMQPANLPDLDTSLACTPTETLPARVQVGWLPVLPIGLVVRNGQVVGQLGAEVRTFSFDQRLHVANVQRLLTGSDGGATPAERGHRRRAAAGFRSNLPPQLPALPDALANPLPGLVEGHLLVIGPRDAGVPGPRLVVPCPEVLRVAYAPHSALARAILDGNWERTRHGVVDVARTVATDGGWTVATLAPLRLEHIAIVGNLCLDRLAAKNANLARNFIVSRADNPSPIHADLPFEWTSLQLRVACFAVPSVPDLWFGHEILGISWPDPPRGPPSAIEWVPLRARPRDPSDPGGGQDGVGGPTTTPPDGDPVDVPNMGDAGPGPETDIVEPGASWLNPPQVTRYPPDGEPRGGTRRPPSGALGGDTLSAGTGARGPTGSAPAAPQVTGPLVSDEPHVSLFGRVVDMLDALVAGGSIIAHEGVDPPPRSAAIRGSLACWAFPAIAALKVGSDDRSNNWFVRDFRRRGGRRPRVIRAAMVRRILHAEGVAYLVEIEPRLNATKPDSYKSLVFVPAEEARLESAIAGLLRVAAERAGVWPEAGAGNNPIPVAGASGVAAKATWIHRRMGKADAEGRARGPLDGAPALGAVAAIVALGG